MADKNTIENNFINFVVFFPVSYEFHAITGLRQSLLRMSAIQQIHQRLAPELKAMNDIIRDSLYTPNALMTEVVTNYLAKTGKQIRPMLVLLSAKMFGEINSEALHAGAALELLHNASLIHDDVVDDTTLRRGRPTINSIWGNHLAVLVGDYFVSTALAAGIATGHLSIISAISALGRELSLGEIDQICNVREHHLDEGSYINMISQKTASLFENCVRMGAEAVDTPEPSYAPLMKYAHLLGLCFQIRDDIFDYFSDEEIGKPTGNDLREGKVTLPLLYALSSADNEESRLMKALLMSGNLSDSDISSLIEFAKRNGGIEYAMQRMREMQEEANRILDQYPQTEWIDCFRQLFAFIITRNH